MEPLSPAIAPFALECPITSPLAINTLTEGLVLKGSSKEEPLIHGKKFRKLIADQPRLLIGEEGRPFVSLTALKN